MLDLQPTHPAWKPREPEWVELAPGVRFQLRRPNGAEEVWIASQAGQALRALYEGRAKLEAAGFSAAEMGLVGDLERLVGLQGFFLALLALQRCLQGWQGVDDPETGAALEVNEDTIRQVLLYGVPEGGDPLLVPVLAWLEGPRRPMAAEAMRLQARAKDGWGGGFERCRACQEEGEGCAQGGSEGGEACPQLKHAPRTVEGGAAWEVCLSPGMWSRAGMVGAVCGLDYRSALLAIEAKGIEDVGSAFKALQAIERGRLEAESDKGEAEAAVRNAGD